MDKENTAVLMQEFDTGKVLDLRVEINDGVPMWFLCWCGTRLENNREFSPMMSKFHTVKKVLYEVYGWAWCDECKKMEPHVKKYTVHYEGGSKQTSSMCPHMYAGYCEARMQDDSIISHITEEDEQE